MYTKLILLFLLLAAATAMANIDFSDCYLPMPTISPLTKTAQNHFASDQAGEAPL